MRTVTEIQESIKYYTDVRNRAKKEGRFRTEEGAQWNIDRCYDELKKLRKVVNE